jgi:hypothetical protein
MPFVIHYLIVTLVSNDRIQDSITELLKLGFTERWFKCFSNELTKAKVI